MKHNVAVKVYVILLFVVFLFVLPRLFIKKVESESFLEKEGYRNIKIVGYGYKNCSNSEIFRTEFEATKDGVIYGGIVCEDFLGKRRLALR